LLPHGDEWSIFGMPSIKMLKRSSCSCQNVKEDNKTRVTVKIVKITLWQKQQATALKQTRIVISHPLKQKQGTQYDATQTHPLKDHLALHLVGSA
jgi:hypothetical protein